jgi:prophage regulatory protein
MRAIIEPQIYAYEVFEMQKVNRNREKTLINRKTLLDIVPLSDRTIYNMEKRGDFPRRIALTSRNVVWVLSEVEQWIEARRNSGAQAPRQGMGA